MKLNLRKICISFLNFNVKFSYSVIHLHGHTVKLSNVTLQFALNAIIASQSEINFVEFGCGAWERQGSAGVGDGLVCFRITVFFPSLIYLHHNHPHRNEGAFIFHFFQPFHITFAFFHN